MSTRRNIRIAGSIVKTLFGLLVFSVCALVLWRVFFSTKLPDSMEGIHVNQPLAEAYDTYGEALEFQYQNQFSMTYSETNAGYFGIAEYVIIPKANQVQVILRYNNSTLKHLQADYQLPSLPEKGGDYFDFTLRQITDLTPTNTGDNSDPAALEILRHTPSHVSMDTTALYTYYRLVFDGVEIDESAVCSILLDIYYVEDRNYEQPAYGALLIYDDLASWIPYRLSAADKQALQAAK
ncbi:MAG: hypothetical protein IJX28_08895 [Clostridia bacterium]|nr:hypothetical protein [Clostridia bacterium]